MMDCYFVAKYLHILCSTVLFGTGIGTAFQMVWAMHLSRKGRVETVHSVVCGVVLADWIFTTPAGIIQPATGLWLIYLQGWALTESWLIATYALYFIALVCWLPVVHLQIKIRNLAAQALETASPLPDEAFRLFKIWFFLGWPAFLGLTGIFWLMITKPQLF